MATAPALAAAPTTIYDELNNEQRAVVDHRAGPLEVFAGPGSGKTKTLTARISALLERGVRPENILALTFTVRATEEMRVRLAVLVGQDASHGVTVSTFHGLCARMLRNHSERFGRTPQYSIYDESDIRRLIADVLEDHDDVDRDELPKGFEAAAVKEIAKAKGALWTPEALVERSENPDREFIAKLWTLVEEEMRVCNAFDFQDLLTNTVQVLGEARQTREAYRSRWRHILVDEFQDTDPSQFALLARIAGPAGCGPDGSLMVVGDDDQSCYGFRGAAVSNLLEFHETFPCARRLVLRRNYRCSRSVLRTALQCIRHNEQRQPKALVTRNGAPEGSVRLRRFLNDQTEATAIATEIAGLRDQGVALTEIMALCRTLRYTHALQQALTAQGIPHRVIGGHSLWERVEIQDALAHIALVCNPNDRQAFNRAVAAPSDRTQFSAAGVKPPTRGVGSKTQAAIWRHAKAAGIDLLQACCGADTLDVRKSARQPLRIFGTALSNVRGELLEGREGVFHTVVNAITFEDGPVKAYEMLLESSENEQVLEDTQRVLQDLRSLAKAAQTYEQEHGAAATLEGFLQEARVEPAQVITAEDDCRMTVSTIHGAKGTEAQVVYVLGCEERVLPSGYAVDASDPLRIEEERRLMYIAVTRAKQQVTLTTAGSRIGGRDSKPSRFLAEAGLL